VTGYTLTRDQILAQIQAAVQDDSEILAFWEAGSSATGRRDQWSDLDLQVLVKDGATQAVAGRVEAAMTALAPIDLRFSVPQPAWHGHWQTFYHLEGAPPELQVDLLILEESKGNRFLEPELHGKVTVYLDRGGYVVQPPTDAAPFAEKLAAQLAATRDRVKMFYPFIAKELRRGRLTDAMALYQSMIIGPLVVLLRMAHDPWRFNFGMRYLNYVLPADRLAKIERLTYVANGEELQAKAAEGYAWFQELLAELEGTDWIAHLEAHR
jgi:hypothetical protein